MTKQTAVLTLLLFAGAVQSLSAQTGKKFDTRDPLDCKSLKKATGSVPSAAQIKDLVTCKSEGTGGGSIFLVQNVTVELGKSRPFSSYSDVGNQDIDNSQPVYPIRGTADKYQCQPPGGSPYPPKGQNCSVRMASPFKGICYKTTFGDWSCPVKDTEDPLKGVQHGMPPPK